MKIQKQYLKEQQSIENSYDQIYNKIQNGYILQSQHVNKSLKSKKFLLPYSNLLNQNLPCVRHESAQKHQDLSAIKNLDLSYKQNTNLNKKLDFNMRKQLNFRQNSPPRHKLKEVKKVPDPKNYYVQSFHQSNLLFPSDQQSNYKMQQVIQHHIDKNIYTKNSQQRFQKGDLYQQQLLILYCNQCQIVGKSLIQQKNHQMQFASPSLFEVQKKFGLDFNDMIRNHLVLEHVYLQKIEKNEKLNQSYCQELNYD